MLMLAISGANATKFKKKQKSESLEKHHITLLDMQPFCHSSNSF